MSNIERLLFSFLSAILFFAGYYAGKIQPNSARPLESQGNTLEPTELTPSDDVLVHPKNVDFGERIPILAADGQANGGGLSESELATLIKELGPEWATPIPANAVAIGDKLGGVPHGHWSLYYEHNNWTDVGKFILGSKHGEWQVYDKDGNLLQRKHYIAGKIQGAWEFRESVEDSWHAVNYRDGELVLD